MSYKKVGGLHFIRLGRFGFSFFISRKKNPRSADRARTPAAMPPLVAADYLAR